MQCYDQERYTSSKLNIDLFNPIILNTLKAPFGAFNVESSIQFSNTFVEDLLKVYEFAEKNSPYL